MSADRRGVDLRGRKDLGEVIGYSYRLYARHFLPLFAIGLTYVPLQMLTVVIQGNDTTPSGGVAALALVVQIAGALVTVVAAGALIAATHDITGGESANVPRALDAAFDRILPLITTNLLLNVLNFASVLAFPYTALRWWRDVLPRERVGGRLAPLGVLVGAFLYFIIRWMFQAQAVILEGKTNWAALDHSAEVTSGQWWRTLGIMLTVVLIAAGPLVVASAASALPTLAATTIISVGFALVLPFIIVAQTLLYYDLKARMQHDDFDLPAA